MKEIIDKIKANPKDVRFSDLVKVCNYYFGEGRQKGSHLIYKTPWPGDPRINFQNKNGKVKPYQVRQVLAAITKLRGKEDD